MKIALVHPYPWPEVRRGAERYLDDLSTYLASRGHAVTIVTGTHGPARSERRSDGVSVVYRHHLLASRFAGFGVGAVETFGVPAFAALRRLRPDIVHALTPSGALAGRLGGFPTLYSVLGHPDASQIPRNLVPRMLFRSAVRRSTLTATLSQASSNALAGTTGRDAVVLPPGVRIQQFPLRRTPRTGAPRLLFSASLSDPRKRVDLALSMFAIVLERHPSARLLLSGEGDPGPAFSLAAQSGAKVREAVDVLGPGSPQEVPERYAAATVTVLPAEHEAFGLVLVESLACGTPVVCVPGGGMPEIAGERSVGRVASAPTAPDLASAVDEAIDLASRPETPVLCAQHARRFDWDTSIGPLHEQLYERLYEQSLPGDTRARVPGETRAREPSAESSTI